MRPARFVLAFGGAVAVGLAVVVLGLAPLAIAADRTVRIDNFAFSPATVTVDVGDTVTWTNHDGPTHTATADDGTFGTGQISSGASKSVTFQSAGTFAYHCAIHPSMTGTVRVLAATGGGGTVTPPATDTADIRADDGGRAFAPVIVGLAAFTLVAFRRARLGARWRVRP